MGHFAMASLTNLAYFLVLIAAHHTCTCISGQTNSEGELSCTLLPLVPSPLAYNGSDLPTVALSCSVTGNHSLDVGSLLYNWTSRVPEHEKYIVTDVFFDCSQNWKFDFVQTRSVNKTLIVTFRFRNCHVTWNDLDFLGQHVYLMIVHIVMANHSWPMLTGSGKLSTNFDGLRNVNQIQLSMFDMPSVPTLNQLLPPGMFPAMGSFVFQCYNSSDPVIFRCNKGFAQYNLGHVKNIFPQLQSLLFYGVYPTNDSEPLAFPWTDKPMILPLNLTRSSYQQEQSSNDIITVPTNQFRRLISLNKLYRINTDSFCAIHGNISRIDLFTTGLLDIPSDCFRNVRGVSIIDMSYNNLTVLTNGTFHPVSTLEQLFLNSNKIHWLERGIFDTLRGLRLLDLHENHLTSLSPGLFGNLASLETLLLSVNMLTTIEPNTLPAGSVHLTFVDFRLNHLTSLPFDCLTLRRLQKCDCDDNRITLHNLADLLDSFNPVLIDIVEPRAYYGEPFGAFSNGEAHDLDQSEISLQNNSITHIPYNFAENMVLKKKLAALLSYFQVTLSSGTAPEASQLECDCELWELRKFILGEGRHLLSSAIHLHTIPYHEYNFDSWRCMVHSMLGGGSYPFLYATPENFICQANLTQCPQQCKCFIRPIDNSLFVNCYNQSLAKFPAYLPIPHSKKQVELRVYLQYNRLSSFPDCNDPRYRWLRNVSRLFLNYNAITSDGVELEHFLSCLDSMEELGLKSNNIKHIPRSIVNRKAAFNFDLGSNPISCCNSYWIKTWLQNNYKHIAHPHSIFCADTDKNDVPILEMDSKDFFCPQHEVAKLFGALVASVIGLIIVAASIYLNRQHIKILLFAKFAMHPFDKQPEIEDANYDSYLLYCDKDYAWVQQTLLIGLERQGFRVYDKRRNSDFGTIEDQIDRAMSTSHRVIVVMSNNFLNDRDAVNEFYRADSHDKSRGKSRYLLMILLSPIEHFRKSRVVEEHAVFSKYLRTGFYVDVIQCSSRFWSRLFYWMPEREALPDCTTNLHTASNHVIPGDELDLHVDESSALLGATAANV